MAGGEGAGFTRSDAAAPSQSRSDGKGAESRQTPIPARRPPGPGGAMITEYPLEHRRYDQTEYEPFWAAAKSLDLPLSLHTATRRQGRMRGAGEETLRQKSRLDDDRINHSTASVRAKLRIPNQDFGAT
jgi:hypothetical protein